MDQADRYSETPNHDWSENYPDLDSMVSITLSWGHSSVGQAHRQKLIQAEDTADRRTIARSMSMSTP